MLLGEVFERFVEQSPVTVMVRGILEKVLVPEKLDELFEKTAKVQYTRELLFSSVVNLMSLVVCGIRPSVNAAYKAKAQEIAVSRTALYDKINGIEPEVSAQLVRYTAQELEPVVKQLGGQIPELLPKAPSPTSNLATGKDWAASAEVKALPPIDSCCQP